MTEASVVEPKSGFVRGMIGLCAIIAGVSPAYSLVPTFGLAFHTQLNIDAVGLGLLAACVSLGYVVASLPMGGVVDRSGGQWVLLSAPALLAAALVVLAVVGTVPVLFVVALLAGAIWAGCVGATNRYSIVLAPANRHGVVMGVVQATIMAVSGVAAFTLPQAASHWGWREGVLMLALAAVVSGAVAAVALRGRHRVPVPVRTTTARRGRPAFPRQFQALLVYGVAMGFAMHCTWTFLLLFLATDVGTSTATASLALGLLFVSAGTGRLLWGLVVDRGTSLWALLVLSALGGAAGILSLELRWGGVWLFLSVIAIGLTLMAHNTIFILAGMRMMPASAWAVAGAALTSAHVVGGVMGPPLFALVVDHGGGYGPAWALLAVILVASMPALRVASRRALQIV